MDYEELLQKDKCLQIILSHKWQYAVIRIAIMTLFMLLILIINVFFQKNLGGASESLVPIGLYEGWGLLAIVLVIISLVVYKFIRDKIKSCINCCKERNFSREELEYFEDRRQEADPLPSIFTIFTTALFGFVAGLLGGAVASLLVFSAAMFLLCISVIFFNTEKEFYNRLIKLIENMKKDETNKNILESIWASSMQIREMVQDDYDIINTMMFDSCNGQAEEEHSVCRQVECTYNQKEHSNLIQDKNKICLVAEINERIIGFSVIGKMQVENFCRVPMGIRNIDKFYISPFYQKKRADRCFFQLIEEKLVREGIQSLRVTALGFNKDAIALYKDVGLKEENDIYVKDL